MTKLQRARVRRLLKPKGAPPGSLVFQGHTRVEKTVLRCYAFGADYFKESEADFNALPAPEQGIVWLDMEGIHEAAEVEKVGNWLGLSTLQMEDILNTDHRAKFEWHGAVFFAIVKMIYHGPQGVEIEQVSLAFSGNKLVTFQERPGDVFEPVRERLRNPERVIRKKGADYLAYALLDVIVDHYLHVIDAAELEMDDLDDDLMENPTEKLYEKIQFHSKAIGGMRRVVVPFRDYVAQLTSPSTPNNPFSEDTQMFLRDLQDHLLRCSDVLDRMKETAASLKDLYFNFLSLKMNRVMQMLTLVTSIFIPTTFIAGIYGMNFDNMPELHSTHGYFYALGAMGVIALAMIYYFYRRGWMK